MDETGGYPGMQYDGRKCADDTDQFLHEATSESSWFGLAISGLKFLLNNQNNNNINKNPQISFDLTNSQSNNSGSSNNREKSSPSSSHTSASKRKAKLHILGPSVFKKQLYDIPEYQSTASNSDKGSTSTLSAKAKSKSKIKSHHVHHHHHNKLTKQALTQLNDHWSNYWNQRSSLHSSIKSDKDDGSVAGSQHTNPSSHNTHPQPPQQIDGDGGSSTVQQQPSTDYPPSMTSSLIIHPTQEKPQGSAGGMKHSRSFPLLHSAEYIQNFENQFSNCEMIPPSVNNHESSVRSHNNGDISFDEEGSQNEYPINVINTNTIQHPQHIQQQQQFNHNVLFKQNMKHFQATKSWESINSSIASVSISNFSEHDDDHFDEENGIITHSLMQGPSSSTRALADLLNDDHFINKTKERTLQQREWLNNGNNDVPPFKQMKSRKSQEINNNKPDTSSFEHIQPYHIRCATEMEWSDFEKEREEYNNSSSINVISCPLPKSVRKNKKKKSMKKKSKSKSKTKMNVKISSDADDETIFSDWSNVSSNVGVITPVSNQ